MKKLLIYIFLLTLIIHNSNAEFSLKKIINLNNPWSISFITEDKLVITEKKGRIKIYDLIKKELKNIPHNLIIYKSGQGGLLDVVYKDNNVWISYSEKLNNSLSRTSVAKAKYNEEKLEFENIFESYPPIKSGYHFGARLAIKNEYLYASIGERGKGMIAQDGTKHPGSIIRIFKSGKVPKSNPYFINKNNWLPEIYQIGVRNPQGLEVSPYDGNVYITNHGAMGGDFFGKISFGGNYGWKILGWGGKNYIGTDIGPKWKKGFNKPIYYWTPSIGISSFVIYKGAEFSEFNGMAMIGSLKYQNLYLLDYSDLSFPPKIYLLIEKELGRIRDIEINPVTGKVYIISNEYLWLLEKKIKK